MVALRELGHALLEGRAQRQQQSGLVERQHEARHALARPKLHHQFALGDDKLAADRGEQPLNRTTSS